jgi:peptidoglycan/LPS O-acetylase OafA/YrhL
MSNERIYFHNLDIIRFIAAFAVVLGHGFGAWSDYYVKFRQTPEFCTDLFSGSFLYVSQFFTNLGIGVEIFFFISGFLITYILLVEYLLIF